MLECYCGMNIVVRTSPRVIDCVMLFTVWGLLIASNTGAARNAVCSTMTRNDCFPDTQERDWKRRVGPILTCIDVFHTMWASVDGSNGL